MHEQVEPMPQCDVLAPMQRARPKDTADATWGGWNNDIRNDSWR